MSSLRPVALYGLKVPSDGSLTDANPMAIPAAFRITMIAIDPTEEYSGESAPRATLKLIRNTEDLYDMEDSEDELSEDDEEIDDDDIEAIKARLGITDDELKNGGPSDPEKSRLAREKALMKALEEDEEEEDDEDDEDDDEDIDMDDLANGINGKLDKGKGKLLDPAFLDGDDDEELVLCTLDPNQHYQQAVDIVINENEEVYFRVLGTHSVHLTGNYLVPEEDIRDEDSEESEYSDEDEDILDPSLYGLEHLDESSEDESEDDELDDLEDPRVQEVSDDEEVPELVKVEKPAKGNKRAAEAEETNGTDKLSKRQAKKLKTNAGQAVAAEKKEEAAPKGKKEQKADQSAANTGKKVSFAEKLEQGPTGSGANKGAEKKGPRSVNGVVVDDKKVGSGPGAKKGDRVGMRYIGKLKDGKVFDSNKKGKPFSFKLGSGEVIKGWDIGVAGLAVGGERRITIPAHLAYGSKAQAGIPANSELVFDLKMISIN